MELLERISRRHTYAKLKIIVKKLKIYIRKGDIYMNSNNQKLILVTGATGLQGGAVANEALKQGFNVRILVRDETSSKAQALVQKGQKLQ